MLESHMVRIPSTSPSARLLVNDPEKAEGRPRAQALTAAQETWVALQAPGFRLALRRLDATAWGVNQQRADQSFSLSFLLS